VITGNTYDKGYYLADGIYLSWVTFVKTVRNPADEKCKRFAKEQEAARKDVERAFGVFQSRWVIIQYPARIWNVMTAYVIMHNMIVENERDDNIYDQG
jgi:leucyl aminopeptidase (aminopeptidase T)